jgi:2-polyprenyl-3-methyl-5-hydroxy-6-metoxy-1,4-benzoquinol methylase
MPNYGDPKYWDKRYRNNEGSMFDWLEDYNSLKSIIKELATSDMKILVLGCGNAEFSEHMYDDGYHNIYNIDISSVVIS